MTIKPGPDLGMLMGGVVVEDGLRPEHQLKLKHPKDDDPEGTAA